MKKTLCILLLLLLCLPLAALGEETLTILVGSDIHYISPRLTDYGPRFERLVREGDSKIMMRMEELSEIFIERVLEIHPDVLILSGDLSFNGGYLSHEDLAVKLARVQEAGIPVAVIPGNHDVNYKQAAKFSGEGYTMDRWTRPEEFQEIYHAFGYDQALSLDPASGSYLYPLREDLVLLMLDANSGKAGDLPGETFGWLEEQLAGLQEKGIRVLGVSHQNILQHNSLYTGGYMIRSAKQVAELYRKYGVALTLAGHMHIQHIAQEEGLTEILTSAISVYPNHIARLKLGDRKAAYQAESLLDVQPELKQYSYDFFTRAGDNGTVLNLMNNGLDDETARRMAALFTEMNLCYFSGTPLAPEKLADTVFWVQMPGAFSGYIRSVVDDLQNGLDHTLREVDW